MSTHTKAIAAIAQQPRFERQIGEMRASMRDIRPLNSGDFSLGESLAYLVFGLVVVAAMFARMAL